MAKSDDGSIYFDLLSNESVVNIFHMLTGGPDWHAVHDVEQWKGRWTVAMREEEEKRMKRIKEEQDAERYMKGIALSSTCTRMRAIASDMRYPLLRLVMPANEDDESMSSFILYLLREEPRFDRIIVICSESASLDVLRNLRNLTKELCLPPDDMRVSDPKVSLHFPTIGGNYDVTTSIESMLFKHIHDELSTNGSQFFTSRTIQEMSSLGYICEHHSYTKTGRLFTRYKGFSRTGFICGKYDQREVKIIFSRLSQQYYIQLVSTYRYSGYVKETQQVSWYENQSTWLGIALRLYHDAIGWDGIGWEDADWDSYYDASAGDD